MIMIDLSKSDLDAIPFYAAKYSSGLSHPLPELDNPILLQVLYARLSSCQAQVILLKLAIQITSAIDRESLELW